MLANVLRPLCHIVDNLTIESRAMSEDRDQRGRLSMKASRIVNLAIADFLAVKSWSVVLSAGQVRPLA